LKELLWTANQKKTSEDYESASTIPISTKGKLGGTMNWQLLIDAGPVVYGHAFAAFGAMAVGSLQFALPKGTTLHRATGYIWVTLISAVAISSFFIHDLRHFGPFSVIHLISAFTLYSVVSALSAARAGNIAKHKHDMIVLYLLAMLLTGAFTLLPGRVMNAVLFG